MEAGDQALAARALPRCCENAASLRHIWTADPRRVLAAVKRGKQALETVH
jgi:hypothetical protein